MPKKPEEVRPGPPQGQVRPFVAPNNGSQGGRPSNGPQSPTASPMETLASSLPPVVPPQLPLGATPPPQAPNPPGAPYTPPVNTGFELAPGNPYDRTLNPDNPYNPIPARKPTMPFGAPSQQNPNRPNQPTQMPYYMDPARRAADSDAGPNGINYGANNPGTESYTNWTPPPGPPPMQLGRPMTWTPGVGWTSPGSQAPTPPPETPKHGGPSFAPPQHGGPSFAPPQHGGPSFAPPAQPPAAPPQWPQNQRRQGQQFDLAPGDPMDKTLNPDLVNEPGRKTGPGGPPQSPPVPVAPPIIQSPRSPRGPIFAPEGTQISTPLGTSRVQGGQAGDYDLTPQGREAYGRAKIRRLETFGRHPWSDDPTAPQPPVEPGKPAFNPFTGEWSEG